MRSRYTAFTKVDVDYLRDTTTPQARKVFDTVGTEQWAKGAKWKGLKIENTEKGGVSDSTGIVEFVATYEQDGEMIDHHEVSKFRKTKDGQWLFVDGEAHTHKAGEGHHHEHESQPPQVRTSSKVGRNEQCPCGSGKKFKKCCDS
jgi:SEC-C motif domain protein